MNLINAVSDVVNRDVGHAWNALDNLSHGYGLHAPAGAPAPIGTTLVNAARADSSNPGQILNFGATPYSAPAPAAPISYGGSGSSGSAGTGGYSGGAGSGSYSNPDGTYSSVSSVVNPTPDYASLYAPQIASIDAQTSGLQNNLGYADTQEQQGLQNLQDQFNQQKSSANQNHSRALQDFQTQGQNDNNNYQQAIDQVNTKARTLADSVRQMLGNASGSGSSAYQLTAPGAVARQANLQNQTINDTFGQNFGALKTAQDREGQDYNNLLTSLQDQFTKGQNGLKTGIEQTKQAINGQLADLAAQRAAYLGGNIQAAQSAAQPYQNAANTSQSAIDQIAAQYHSPFASVTPVQVAAPSLRDYVTGQTHVANQAPAQTATTPNYNPVASWFKQDQQNQANPLMG